MWGWRGWNRPLNMITLRPKVAVGLIKTCFAKTLEVDAAEPARLDGRKVMNRRVSNEQTARDKGMQQGNDKWVLASDKRLTIKR